MRRFATLFVHDRVVNTVLVVCFATIMVSQWPDLRASSLRWLAGLETVCAVYFVIEMLLKRWLQGVEFWHKAGNRFDVVLVGFSTIGLALTFATGDTFAVLSIARMARLFKSLRLLRFVPNSDLMMAGIIRALKASVGILVFLAIYALIHAVISCGLFGKLAPEHFGDPALSFYSIIKVLTVEGWYEIPDLIHARSHDWMGNFARAYFVFIVLTGGILGLSIANAIFVDEMTMDNNTELESKIEELKQELRALRQDLAQRNSESN